MNYKTERYEAVVSVPEYVEACVDVQEFLPFCQACPNYNQTWSCPEFDFDPYDYWKKYQTFRIIGIKIIIPDEIAGKTWSQEECGKMIEEMLWKEKKKLSDELYELEKEYPGSISLSAGTCQICGAGNCSKKEGQPCRFPEKLRYSIESLGGNVGLTVTKYLKQQLEWIEEGKMPLHGTKDRLVPFHQSIELYKCLKKNEKNVTFYRIEEGDHGGEFFWHERSLEIVDDFIKGLLLEEK